MASKPKEPPVLKQFICSDCGKEFSAIEPPAFPIQLPGKVFCTWVKATDEFMKLQHTMEVELPISIVSLSNTGVCQVLSLCVQELKKRGELNKHQSNEKQA